MTTNENDPEINQLWAAMAAEDKAVLRPFLIRRHLPQGDVVTRTGHDVETVYLPTTADLANVVRFTDGRSGMATNVGREGVTGLAAFLANEPCGWDVEVQISGDAWALPASRLRARVKDSPALLQLLMTLTHNNQVEAAQNSVCNALHTVTPRLARWLLTIQDRTGRSEFHLTQDDLATTMSVRRTTVNASWQELGRAGAIRARRGVVKIVSREVLERASCECYGALRRRTAEVG
jgi:CRP-like cAMP-binding protein